MIKKAFSVLLIFILAALSVSCGTLGIGSGASNVGYGFAEAIANRDYSAAFGYLYKNSADLGTQDEFAQRYTNIMSAMQVSDIKLVTHSVVANGQLFDLKYTLQMTSALMGKISYDYDADVIPDGEGYAVMYTPSLILPFLESGDTVRVQTEYGQRGEIFDKNKELLAKNDYAQSVYIEIAKIKDKDAAVEAKNLNAAASAIKSVIGVDTATVADDYNNAAANKLDVAVVKAFPKYTLTQAQKDALTAVPGVEIDETSLSPIRYYPMQDNSAQVVGYMGSPSDQEVAAMADKGITKDSLIGKTGLEAAYEDELRGTNGFKLFVQDSLGNEKKVLYEKPKQDGEDLVLTMDSKIQDKAYTLLSENVKQGDNGAVIVMDYKTGDVQAMVSYPSFDPNYFSFPMDPKVWDYLNSNAAGTPLISRATQATYPPGSAFKPFSIVPALETGKITPETVPDIKIVNNQWIPDVSDWFYPSIKRASETIGDFNMMNAMKSSDNIFYAYAAMQTGIDPFMAYMQKIGMGDVPSFELPIKKSNLLNKSTQMDIKILADMGYGMGELLVSPLQLASMYTAILNNGDMLNPTIVGSIYQTKDNTYSKVWENSKTVFKADSMKPTTIDTLMQALHLVVDSGTAYPAKLPGVNMVGKTGTAQVGQGNSREINWIVLMGLDDGNQKLVLVMLDTLKDQGAAKFTIARELMKPDGYVDPTATNPADTANPSGTSKPTDAVE